MEKVMSNGLLVSTIMEHLPVSDLIQCAQVNPLWEQMAVKWLNRKAIVNLDYDEKPMSTYLKMVRGDGDETIGRCHDQIALDGMGSRNVRDIFFGSKHTVTREQFDTLVAAVQEFGHCVKTLKVQLEFGEGKPLPTEYQTIFSSAQNVEFLSFEFQFPGHLESLATLPPQLSFPHLKILSFCTTCIRPLTDGLKWTEESLRAVLGKITAAAPNLADVSAGRDETMGIILEEVAKSGGIRRLEEKIQAIETCPKTRTTTILMETGFENLKTLKLAIRSETRDNFGKIVEKYKHTLEKLHVSLAYGGGGWLIFPKSMDRLEELHVDFNCPFFQDEYAKKYPALKFPSCTESGHEFYPKLEKVVMGGTRQTERVMPKYLAIIFPGQYWRKRLPMPEFGFPSVRHLELEKYDYDVEEWDLATFRRIVNYFPNLYNADTSDIATEYDDDDDSEDTSEEEFFSESDSDE